MTRIAIPALIAMLAVAGFVGAAGSNRSGEPLQVITLSERELNLPHRSRSADEDPGLVLRIAYDARPDPLDARNWLPETRLRDIGFSLHVPPGAPQAVDTYDHVPARLAWVALEYDGPQWREIARRRALRNAEPPVREQMWSRLVPVDAADTADELRTRYPTGHLIMRAVIGLSYVRTEDRGAVIHGRLREVVPQAVAVPYEFRALFEGMTTPTSLNGGAPRYEVDLAIGRHGLPYVRAVRLQTEP
jgi:hypothetical protein